MRPPRTALAAAVTCTVLAAVTACGGSSDSNSSSSSSSSSKGTYTFWDPYPQFDGSSDWARLVASCGSKAGVKVKRTGMDTTELGNKALLAAQKGGAPDVMLVDNPVVSTLVEAGMLTKMSEVHVPTGSVEKNIIGAGTIDGAAYGVPIGANTLALYYNKDVLAAAHVDPASIKDWASLTAALGKVKGAGKKGITFSAIGTEEGSFQFLPWFWGAKGDLTHLDGAGGVAALSLWKDWVSQGLAPKDVLTNTQTTSWQEFATGQYAFGENGTWQLANAEKAGFPYGVISIPGKDGGSAPAPTGGEFATVPVQQDTARYTASAKIVTCLTDDANLLATDTTLSYIAPTGAVQDQQVAKSPALGPWKVAVGAARGRTSNGLGTKYPVISEQLWGAVQSALSGGKSPKDALTTGQQAVNSHQG